MPCQRCGQDICLCETDLAQVIEDHCQHLVPLKEVCPRCDLKYDVVERPEHYASGKVECIDAIQSALTPEEFRGYLKGNIIKYTWRSNLKGGQEDLRKCQWYMNRLVG